MARQFEVVPIPGREVVQRNFANLLKNGYEIGKKKYSNNRITLNDRFTLMYHGFTLREVQPVSPSASDTESDGESSNNTVSSGTVVNDRKEAVEKEPVPSIKRHCVHIFLADEKKEEEQLLNLTANVEKKSSKETSKEVPKKRKRTRRVKNSMGKREAKKVDVKDAMTVEGTTSAVSGLSLGDES
uniref:DUF2439 domain-containing protein n=1 Tax=Steinernema glaseri TaxID=37863 RepID=A0A1I8AKD4_9BILA